MKIPGLDGRHRWGDHRLEAGCDVWTCQACGRVVKFERFLPDAILDALTRVITAPNPYRAMFNTEAP